MTSVAVEAPPDVSAMVRSARYPAAVAVIVLALVAILAVIGEAPNTTPLDPRNDSPDGTHALAALLADRGVTVTLASTLPHLEAAATAGTTIVVSEPAALSGTELQAISRTAATVLLVDPMQNALSAFAVTATPGAQILATTLNPGCSLAAAVTAGSARVSGELYTVTSPVTQCYRQGGAAALISSARTNGATTIVLGSAATLTNGQLATEGDAALALSLLDTSAVQWVSSDLVAGATPKSKQGLLNLLPSRLLWATLQLFIALVVLALWRARRLGRPVVEPLPVVVRAAETVEGRARLLHAARSRDAAARSLRAAAVRRLSRVLRLGPDEAAESVTALVSERANQPAGHINSLLYGGEPADDAAFVRLAQELPRLESAITRNDVPPPGGQQ
jgi:hypothetical protein